jgi:phenylacetate-coenzyme A ligase PaaK-like adenylate-forming protein
MSYMSEQLHKKPSIHRIVEHAFYANAFYRGKLTGAQLTPDIIWSAEDLRRVPLTSRGELRGDPWILLADDKRNVVQAHASTGTTGQAPLFTFFNWEDLTVRGLLPLAEGANGPKLGIERGALVANALPYEVSVTGNAIHRALQDGVGACVISVGKGGFYADPAKTLRVIADLEPKYLFTTPSYALHLGRVRDELYPTMRWRPAAIWLIGEACSSAYRTLIERAWDASARIYYGTMECGTIGVECTEKSGFHVATNHVHVEVLPVEGLSRDDLPRLGEIVVTNLTRYASPVIRYRTEDLGYFDPSPCRCGCDGPRLHVLGRQQDAIRLNPSAVRFAGEIENSILGLAGVDPTFRLRPTERGLTVLLPGKPDESTGARVRDAIARRLGLVVDVEWIPASGYGGGKFQRILREENR